jgi:hypothetical protein
MKKLQLLILLGMFMGSSQFLRSQVFGHAGATWVFHEPMFGMCSEQYEISEYLSDTSILGVSAKNVRVITKIEGLVPPYAWTTSTKNRFFHVSGDTVSLFNGLDSTWHEVYNFSVQVGDSVLSPLNNPINGWSLSCPTALPYTRKAVVTQTGTSMVAGQSLRYYTIKFQPGLDTNHVFQTYYERIITQDFWHPNDGYWCGAVAECSNPELLCYKDNGMSTGTACDDVSQYITLSVSEETSHVAVQIYPNPTHDVLIITTNEPNPGKYEVLGVDGKTIAAGLQSPINVEQLAPGVYLVTNESHTWYKKFIKE